MAAFETAAEKMVRPMSANHDAAGRLSVPGTDPRDEARYGAFDLDPDSTIIYDAENEAAWIQFDAAVRLSVRR